MNAKVLFIESITELRHGKIIPQGIFLCPTKSVLSAQEVGVLVLTMASNRP